MWCVSQQSRLVGVKQRPTLLQFIAKMCITITHPKIIDLCWITLLWFETHMCVIHCTCSLQAVSTSIIRTWAEAVDEEQNTSNEGKSPNQANHEASDLAWSERQCCQGATSAACSSLVNRSRHILQYTPASIISSQHFTCSNDMTGEVLMLRQRHMCLFITRKSYVWDDRHEWRCVWAKIEEEVWLLQKQ